MNDAPEPVLADGTEPATAEDLIRLLAELEIEASTVRHPPVFTVEEAKALRGKLPGAHTKNLFVRDTKGVMCLVVAREDCVVDLAALAGKLGMKRLSFGSPGRLMKYLGVIPGAVTPFSVVNDHGGEVSVALDAGLRGYDFWSFHPLDNTMTTTLRPADMLRFLEEMRHPPTWVDL